MPQCWRVHDGVECCPGTADLVSFTIELPIVLILEVQEEKDNDWDFPGSLKIPGNNIADPAVTYDLVGRGLYSRSKSHYVTRYCDAEQSAVFTYDGKKNGGSSVREHGGKAALKTHLCGLKIDTPPTFTTSIVIYHMRGGLEAQQNFAASQRLAAERIHRFGFLNNPLPTICLQRPGFDRVKDEDRFWLKNPYEARTIDYIFNAEDAGPEDHVSVPAGSPDIDKADSSSGEENDSTSHDDEDEPGDENASLKSNNSSNSTTPCPIHCYGCGQISDGDDDPEQVQCLSCGFWSHFKCQPNADEVEWNDPEVIFTCQGCRPRPPELFLPGEIVMLPDPFVKSDWRSEDVLWYPARFIKHHPHTREPKNEFEFCYMDCVDWVKLTEDYIFRPSRHCKHDWASCQEMLNFAPMQIGKIRTPACYSKPVENHPLIKIFDAAVGPLANLLVSFPDDHPVVKPYNEFFTELAMGPEDNERIRAWTPSWNGKDKELIALRKRPLEKLLDFSVASVPDPEWRRRVMTVGRVLLLILAIQHELEEPLDLNGDMYEDLVQGAVIRGPRDYERAVLAMLLSTKPKCLSHKKYWDQPVFRAWVQDFKSQHTFPDPTYRPRTGVRIHQPDIARPPILIDSITSTEEVSAKRPRPDDDEDTPAPKRRGIARSLRQRGPKGPQKEIVVAVPVGRIVASGKGWVEIEADDDI
ncbi:hypothetical protein C8F04DRAFT_1294531 [Mycena alexandri]|uniref:Zinc finger PHD-type domain-containing protein n=1 Tax=Mycena alexandri TaxID=1745969 RepID=A0AAD6SGS7_9AGAR|nr:hypothetical protein C8F04DRAFT_1294531 [Mycena alexandri]